MGTAADAACAQDFSWISKMLSVAFAGTPEFAAKALAAILEAGYPVPLVLTQPDRPAGRGMAVQASPVKQLALERGLPVHQPPKLNTPEARQPLVDVAPDVLVVAAYGLILPQVVLDTPRLGCVNIHASLLPRWRGAAPIQRAIQAGDTETGITIMQMDKGLDTGAMLLTGATPIGPGDTAATLHDRLADMGGALIVDALKSLEAGALTPVPQPAAGVTYAAKLAKSESLVDWRAPAAVVARTIRAFNPFPVAQGVLGGATLKLWGAEACSGAGAPGRVLAADAEGVVVACGEGAVRLTQLQKPGGKRLTAADFLRGFALKPGDGFELPAAD